MHGGNRWGASLRYGTVPERFIDFSANINPLGMPPGAKEAMAEAVFRAEEYPEPGGIALREMIAGRVGVSPENVFLGNGASEILYLWAALFRPQRAVIFPPTFSDYARAVVAFGGEVIDGVANPGAKGDAVFCCNPNNPTGCLQEKPAVLALGSRGKTLLVDESFLEFAPEPPDYTLALEAAQRDSLVLLVSLTKFYAMPGLRLGYCVAGRQTIRALEAAAPPWRVNVMAEAAGLAALGDEAYAIRSRRTVEEERTWLREQLSSIPGVFVYPGAVANFLLLRMPTPGVAPELGSRGILVREWEGFSGLEQNQIRVAVRGREENRILCLNLAKVLDQLNLSKEKERGR